MKKQLFMDFTFLKVSCISCGIFVKKGIVYMLVLLLGFTCSCSKDNDNTEKEKSSENKEASNNEETNNDIKVRLTSADLIDGSYFDGILYYRIISNTDNFVEISQVTKSAKSIEIPRKIIIDNTVFTVTSLGNNSFQDCKDLSYITIPSSITSVGNHAFSGCSRLEKVTIGHAVKALEGGTFYRCDNIREVWSYIEEPFDVIDYEYAPGEMVLYGRCFPEAVTSEATLYIPKGTKEKYLAKSGWRDFVNISDVIQTTGIKEVGRDATKAVRYYSIDGKRIATPQRGLNIIRTSDGKTKKVVVK